MKQGTIKAKRSKVAENQLFLLLVLLGQLHSSPENGWMTLCVYVQLEGVLTSEVNVSYL